jgi:GNAT superfamily N-acetyltransferase
MTPVIRRARAEDAPALTAMMHASSAYADGYARILEGYAIVPEQIARDHMFIADAEATLGFYSLTLLPQPELDLLFVADKAQGRGIGRLLMDHCRAKAATLGISTLRIVSHPPALGFYQANGARRIGTKPPSGKVQWDRPILELAIA